LGSVASTPEQAPPIPPAPEHQTRNLLCYAAINALLYLCAPVLYVDVLHATLLDKLGASKAVANLPMSAFFLTSVTPLVVHWLIPDPRRLRAILAVSYICGALAGAGLAAALVAPISPGLQIAAVIVYAAVVGAAFWNAGVYIWDALAQGVGEAWRGRALGLSFGIGPVFAVAGSLATQAVVGRGDGPGAGLAGLHFPRDYAALFSASFPALILAAALALGLRLPRAIPGRAEGTAKRLSFGGFILGGIRDLLQGRHFVLLCLSYWLFAVAFGVLGNVSLNVRNAVGVEPKTLAGTMLALRFGGKVIAGLGLGLLLSRRGARAAAVTAVCIMVISLVWAMSVHGPAYLAAFALLGAAELSCVYYSNYCVAVSRPEQVNRNVAFLQLALLPSFAAATVHGWVADQFGFEVSFALALAAAVAAVVTARMLPGGTAPRPHPAPLRGAPLPCREGDD